MPKLIIALPKGRILEETIPFFNAVGIKPEDAFFDKDSRLLRFKTNLDDVELIRVRSFDVATFVAFGAAQIGVCGNDVLAEFDYPEIYAPIDLGIGKCRMSAAAPAGYTEDNLARAGHVRVATKYPNITKKYYQSKVFRRNASSYPGRWNWRRRSVYATELLTLCLREQR